MATGIEAHLQNPHSYNYQNMYVVPWVANLSCRLIMTQLSFSCPCKKAPTNAMCGGCAKYKHGHYKQCSIELEISWTVNTVAMQYNTPLIEQKIVLDTQLMYCHLNRRRILMSESRAWLYRCSIKFWGGRNGFNNVDHRYCTKRCLGILSIWKTPMSWINDFYYWIILRICNICKYLTFIWFNIIAV